MPAPAQEREPENFPDFRFPWRGFWIVAVTALVTVSMILVSARTGHHMTAKYAPLVDAAMEMRLEATLAHLWLEEILGGDESETYDKVTEHIDNAFWYANAMLHGGHNSEGDFQPLTEAGMRDGINAAVAKLEKFREISQKRYESRYEAGSGTPIDVQFDEVFRDFSEAADAVETRLQYLIEQKLHSFDDLQVLLVSGCLLLSMIVFSVYYQAEKRRAQTLGQLKAADQMLDRLSVTDGLTGVPNRRFLDEQLESEWKRAARGKSPLSVAMVDIDCFKAYNDCLGHLEGDRCLKQIANCLRRHCRRPGDTVARFGGEEFALILPDTSAPKDFLESLRRAVEELQIPHPCSEVSANVTVSIGLSTRIPEPGAHPMALLKAADDALYKAKQGGRNRVEDGATGSGGS